MGSPIAITVLVLILLVIGWIVVSSGVLTTSAEAGEVHVDEARDQTGPGEQVLRYQVPEGQDPAVVLGALATHGFDASTEPGAMHQYVLIEGPAAADREAVREVLSSTRTSMLDGRPIDTEVRFADETGPPAGAAG